MNPEQSKSGSSYIFYRVYCVIALILWNVLCIFWFFPHIKQDSHNPHTAVMFLVMAIFIGMPLLIMISSLAIFPFKYSIFGPNIRTPFPQEPPVFEQANSWGRIGWLSGRGVSFKMHIFQSGVGLSFFGKGKVFIPKENICSLENNFLMGYKMTHNSPELRNPVIFSSKDNYEKIQEILHQQNRN